MSEPIQDWSAYDAFIKDAERDDRVGDHDFMVTSVDDALWPSGDKFKKVRGQLTTASGAKADFNLNPLPTPEEMAQSSTWETGKKRGVAQGILFNKNLAKFYSKSADTLQPGDELRIKTVKNKEGYIRVAAILDPRLAKTATGPKAAPPKSDIPF